jgi:hypothetical protein
MNTKAFFTLIASFVFGVISSKATIFTGPVVNPATGHSYYLTAQDTWTGAQATATGLGGSLVTINDAAENQWVFDTFASFGGVNRLLWLGLHDASQLNPSSPSSYQWVDGENSSYRNWNAGEPSAWTPDEFYVYMYPNGYDGIDSVRTPATWNTYRNLSTEFGPGSPWPNTPLYGVVEVVPEPSVIALLALAGILGLKRKSNA